MHTYTFLSYKLVSFHNPYVLICAFFSKVNLKHLFISEELLLPQSFCFLALLWESSNIQKSRANRQRPLGDPAPLASLSTWGHLFLFYPHPCEHCIVHLKREGLFLKTWPQIVITHTHARTQTPIANSTVYYHREIFRHCSNFPKRFMNTFFAIRWHLSLSFFKAQKRMWILMAFYCLIFLNFLQGIASHLFLL